MRGVWIDRRQACAGLTGVTNCLLIDVASSRRPQQTRPRGGPCGRVVGMRLRCGASIANHTARMPDVSLPSLARSRTSKRPGARHRRANTSERQLQTRESVAALPAPARKLIEIIGLQCTTWLVDCYGGTSLRVPGGASEPSKENQDLTAAIGQVGAAALIKRYSGQTLNVPACRDGLRAVQREINADQARIAFAREDRQDLNCIRGPRTMLELPETAHDLVEIIGLQSTMDLVARFGGQDFKVPAGYRAANWRQLVDAIGLEAATKLVASQGGATVYIPLCTSALKLERARQLVELVRKGGHIREVSRQFGVSLSYAYRLFKRSGMGQQPSPHDA